LSKAVSDWFIIQGKVKTKNSHWWRKIFQLTIIIQEFSIAIQGKVTNMIRPVEFTQI